jgi:hypothetical protein
VTPDLAERCQSHALQGGRVMPLPSRGCRVARHRSVSERIEQLRKRIAEMQAERSKP